MNRLNTQYQYAVTDEQDGIHVVLKSNDSNAQKVFFHAGVHGQAAVAGLTSHLDSLTDDQCGSFFDRKVITNKKKSEQK